MNTYYKNNYNYNNIKTNFGSKSITNRILFICLNSKKIKIKIINALISSDTKCMINLIKKTNLYIKIRNNIIKIIKTKILEFKKTNFYFNNAGTVIRPIITFLIINNIKKNITIKADKRMYKRPIYNLIKDLYKITYNSNKIIFIKTNNNLPIKILKSIKKNKIKNKIKLKNNKSSQFITSIILNILPKIKIYTKLKFNQKQSKEYINLTINILKLFYSNIVIKNNTLKIRAIKIKKINKIKIEGDGTSISYIIQTNIIYKKNIIINNYTNHSLQNETKIIKIISNIKNLFYYKNNLICYKNKIINKNFITIINCKSIADSSMILPITIFLEKKIIKIININNWMFKESNRINSLTKEIKKFKITLYKGKNWIIFFNFNYKKKYNKYRTIKTYNDHRIAMIFNTIKQIFKNIIIKPNCVKKTIPLFFNEIHK